MAKKNNEKLLETEETSKDPQVTPTDQKPNDSETEHTTTDGGNENSSATSESTESEIVNVTWRINIKHNNKRYRAGDSADVGRKELEELLSKKAIHPPGD